MYREGQVGAVPVHEAAGEHDEHVHVRAAVQRPRRPTHEHARRHQQDERGQGELQVGAGVPQQGQRQEDRCHELAQKTHLIVGLGLVAAALPCLDARGDAFLPQGGEDLGAPAAHRVEEQRHVSRRALLEARQGGQALGDPGVRHAERGRVTGDRHPLSGQGVAQAREPPLHQGEVGPVLRLQLGGRAGEVDLHRLDPGHAAKYRRHLGAAGGTVHAVNPQRDPHSAPSVFAALVALR